MHKFPSEEERQRRKEWKIKLKINKPIPKAAFVCSKHFLPSDFFRELIEFYKFLYEIFNTFNVFHLFIAAFYESNPRSKRLRRTAVPSQCLPKLKHERNVASTEKENRERRDERARKRSINVEDSIIKKVPQKILGEISRYFCSKFVE